MVNQKTVFYIGGVTFSLDRLPDGWDPLLGYLQTAKTHRKPMLEIQIEKGHPPEGEFRIPLCRKDSEMALYEDAGRRGIECLNGSFPRFTVLLQKNLPRGTVYLNGESHHGFVGLPLFKCFIYHLLLPDRGFFMHAAGIEDSGKGLLFVGPKGAGKSTLSEIFLRAGSTVLSDELTIVRKFKKHFWIFGSPWTSTCPCFSLKGVPLRAIFLLRHGLQNKVKRIKGKELFKRFAGEIFLPPWPSEQLPVLTSLPFDILSQVPSYLLSFTPTPEVVPFIRQALRKNT